MVQVLTLVPAPVKLVQPYHVTMVAVDDDVAVICTVEPLGHADADGLKVNVAGLPEYEACTL